MKVNNGSIWLGREWEDAIKLSLDTADCGIEKVLRDKQPDVLLNNEKVFAGYQIFGWGNRRKYKTRIPKSLNQFVENLLNQGVK